MEFVPPLLWIRKLRESKQPEGMLGVGEHDDWCHCFDVQLCGYLANNIDLPVRSATAYLLLTALFSCTGERVQYFGTQYPFSTLIIVIIVSPKYLPFLRERQYRELKILGTVQYPEYFHPEILSKGTEYVTSKYW